MTNESLQKLIDEHGKIYTVNLEDSQGKLFQVAFKHPSDDVLELAYSKENFVARGKSFYANCFVDSDDNDRLKKDDALRQKAYVAALTIDQSGVGVGELKALSGKLAA
jgi:hypothetical protein